MPVPPEQLSALASLEHAKSLRQLADENATPYPSMQKAVNKLETLGIVITIRQGKERLVRPASPHIPGLARTLIFDAPRQDWRSIFHGNRLVLLHVLDRVRDPTLTAEVLDVKRSTVYHAIKTHSTTGLLLKDDAGYRINSRLMDFRKFLAEWNSLRSTKAIHDIDGRATALWRLGPELMFRSTNPIEKPGIHLGAYSAMAAHGAPLIDRTDATTYYYSKRALTPLDAVLQAMIIDGNEAAETARPPAKTTRAQWTAYIEFHVTGRPAGRKDLARRARIYNKVDEVNAILRFLDRRDEPGFLPWSEYERFRQQFGVLE